MEFKEPILIVSTTKENKLNKNISSLELKQLASIEKSNAQGIFITDYRPFDPNNFFSYKKLILTDDKKQFEDSSNKISNLGFVIYSPYLSKFETDLKEYSQKKQLVIPSISSIDHARIFNHAKLSNCPFVDISPVGLCSRFIGCGYPINIGGVEEILNELNPKTPFILSGGIRLECHKDNQLYSIKELFGQISRLPAGIMVGSNISNLPSEQIPEMIEKYITEMKKFY